MPGPTQLITDVAKINREYDAREKQRQETLAAYEEGALAYHAAIKHIDGEPSKEAAAHAAFMSGNPYQMVSYGDEGHQRPAWFDGFNDAMAALYGVPREEQDQAIIKDALHGISPDGRTRIRSLEEAEEVVAFLKNVGHRVRYWAEDRGANVSPRYAVIRAFQIGEPVSYGFNGDSYPCGRIVSITGTDHRIITVQNHNGVVEKFWRRKKTGSWKTSGGTWSLQHGWHNERNASF